MKKYIFAGAFFSLMLGLACGTVSASNERRVGAMPAPEIISPTENVNVSEDGLEFRWSMGARPDYTDFRLYRGTEMLEKNLILKERVADGKSAFRVPASMFERGVTYAWSVKLVGMRKSRSVYALFTVKEGGAHVPQAA